VHVKITGARVRMNQGILSNELNFLIAIHEGVRIFSVISGIVAN
jgi:hypothetical protein